MNSYSLPLSIANAIVAILVVSGFLAMSRDYTNFVILGPSTSIEFAGFVIDTWADPVVIGIMTGEFLRKKKDRFVRTCLM